MVRVSPAPISYGQLEALVARPADGAVVSFYGVVRDHSGDLQVEALEYEAYVPMAERELTGIVEEARQRWDAGQIAVLHRIGHLRVGEISVAIAVGAEHRAAAFGACSFVIEAIKSRVPVWKREIGPQGARWVGAEH